MSVCGIPLFLFFIVFAAGYSFRNIPLLVQAEERNGTIFFLFDYMIDSLLFICMKKRRCLSLKKNMLMNF